jgi:hypothetical protein
LRKEYGISVDTGKNGRKDGTEDFDDTRINLRPEITIKNPDPSSSTSAAKVRVVFLGRSVLETKHYVVLKCESFDLVVLGPLKAATFAMEPITAAFDDRGYAKFGARYLGYVVLIHDEAGTQIYDSEAIPATLVREPMLGWLKLQTGQECTADLKPVAAH